MVAAHRWLSHALGLAACAADRTDDTMVLVARPDHLLHMERWPLPTTPAAITAAVERLQQQPWEAVVIMRRIQAWKTVILTPDGGVMAAWIDPVEGQAVPWVPSEPELHYMGIAAQVAGDPRCNQAPVRTLDEPLAMPADADRHVHMFLADIADHQCMHLDHLVSAIAGLDDDWLSLIGGIRQDADGWHTHVINDLVAPWDMPRRLAPHVDDQVRWFYSTRVGHRQQAILLHDETGVSGVHVVDGRVVRMMNQDDATALAAMVNMNHVMRTAILAAKTGQDGGPGMMPS